MANITLKDGAVREVAEGTTVLDFVKSFSNSLAKKALACKIDGETKDLNDCYRWRSSSRNFNF